jgi:hypothetical protein
MNDAEREMMIFLFFLDYGQNVMSNFNFRIQTHLAFLEVNHDRNRLPL